MVKNEIEFMHQKLEGVSDGDEAAILSEGKFRFEKEFTTGQIGLSLINEK